MNKIIDGWNLAKTEYKEKYKEEFRKYQALLNMNGDEVDIAYTRGRLNEMNRVLAIIFGIDRSEVVDLEKSVLDSKTVFREVGKHIIPVPNDCFDSIRFSLYELLAYQLSSQFKVDAIYCYLNKLDPTMTFAQAIKFLDNDLDEIIDTKIEKKILVEIMLELDKLIENKGITINELINNDYTYQSLLFD